MSATQKKYSMPKKFKYLAIGGGGYRTIYAEGVMNKLHELGILQDIECVSVTSGGFMAGFLLALGYNPSQSMEFLKKHVLDGKFQIPLTFIPKHIDSPEPYYAVNQKGDGILKQGFKHLGNLGIHSYLLVKNVLDIAQSGGIFHTEGLAEILWTLIKESPTLPAKYKKKNLTFYELHQCKMENPNHHFVDLFVIVTETTAKGPKEKCYSYLDTPDASVITAGSASMAIPILFRKVGSKKNLYDGAIVNNLPRNVFDKPDFVEEKKEEKTEINMQTLAICFADSEATIAEWRDGRPNTKPLSMTARLGQWIILNLIYDEKLWKEQLKEHRIRENALRTIYLNCAEIPILGPKNLSTKRYLEICHQVAEQTEESLKSHFPEEKSFHSPTAFSEASRHCTYFKSEASLADTEPKEQELMFDSFSVKNH